ncbi:MAG: hypothetical protein A4E62_00713 [Syntrophorhabdus sp. PtaU1.Bin002]|nr:MAG: hypothetical protein A4E58_01039 [Syntrophorhabdus sp. PtaB.Bin006]OPY72898.1 MAG: hypothetical protein A4E62_00713 [Syntrophorhabdus sp. PtaU1.Bin002]
MGTEGTLCVVCAWRKDCQKKFRKSQDVTLKCPDFSRDLSIKNGESENGQATGKEDNKGSV